MPTRTGAPSAGRAPGGTPRPADAAADVDRPVWFAFRYSLHGRSDAVRAAVWRELKDMQALNVRQRTWAVAERADEHERLAELTERVCLGGGAASLDRVGHDTPTDDDLQSRLDRACERLWDDFFSAAESSPALLQPDAHPSAERRAAIQELRARFAATTARDIVGSEAGRRADARLSALTTDLHGSGEPDPDIRPHARAPRVHLATSWALCGGATHFVARLEPLPDAWWDEAFAQFEAYVYLPSPDRVPLRHGTFTATAPAGEVAARVADLDARVQRFLERQG